MFAFLKYIDDFLKFIMIMMASNIISVGKILQKAEEGSGYSFENTQFSTPIELSCIQHQKIQLPALMSSTACKKASEY